MCPLNRGKITRWTGYTAAEAIGKRTNILKSGQHGPEFYKHMWDTILSGRTWLGEIINRRKDGSLFTQEVTITPVSADDGTITHFIAILLDVTEKKLLEKQVLQSQKMQAVGQLAGGIAHDFNNLLTVINGYSKMMLSQSAPDDPGKADLEEILKAGECAESLVKQLLSFSRQQVFQPKIINLNELILDMGKMFKRLIPENTEVTILTAPDLCAVNIDPGSFHQVVTNLVVNASHAMPEGGKIMLETKNVVLGPEYARNHHEVIPGEYVLLAVSDTGTGMSETVKDHLFEPFFTTKEKGKGTGLGLSTVYGIVKKSDGFIEVYSEMGHGTSFKIYLPRVHAAPQVWYDSESAEPLPKGNETALIVEDEVSVRRFITHVLCELGYEVLEASNGEEALHLAQGYRAGPIHLLITDMVMPQMGGRELADKLKPSYPGIKSIFVSGYTENIAIYSRNLKADESFLQKPFSQRAMAFKVRQMLDGGSPQLIG